MGPVERPWKIERVLCGACRRYGHNDAHCVRSYASIMGPGQTDEVDEHLMDVMDAEQTATGRRPTFKPRPNLPPDRTGTQTTPPL
ncbi:hypothetical protein MRX96_005844 [Rhipicephalus microplus]